MTNNFLPIIQILWKFIFPYQKKIFVKKFWTYSCDMQNFVAILSIIVKCFATEFESCIQVFHEVGLTSVYKYEWSTNPNQ